MFRLFLLLILLDEPLARAEDFCPKAYATLVSSIQRPLREVVISQPLQAELLGIWTQANQEIKLQANNGIVFSPRWKKSVNWLEEELSTRTDLVEDLRNKRRMLRDQLEGIDTPMTVEMLAQKNSIDQEVDITMREIDAISELLVPMREWLGLSVIQALGSEIAKSNDAIILLRNTPAAAAGQLVGSGVGKAMSFKFHSSDMGVIAGLVPRDQALSKAAGLSAKKLKKIQEQVEQAIANGSVESHPFQIGTNVAVKRNGSVVFVDKAQEVVDPKDLVEVIVPKGAKNGWLVSDIDAFAFGFKGPVPKAENTAKWGVRNEREQVLIDQFNAGVDEKIGRNSGRYMTHGPENRNPNSSGISGYPLSAFMPDGQVRQIPEGPAGDPDKFVKEFFKEARKKGFNLEENPLWGWPES